MNQSAMTVKVCETACDSPRATCAPGRRVANAARPAVGNTAPAQIVSELSERAGHHFAERQPRHFEFHDGAGGGEHQRRAGHAGDAERDIVPGAAAGGSAATLAPRAGIDHSADEVRLAEARWKVAGPRRGHGRETRRQTFDERQVRAAGGLRLLQRHPLECDL